MTASIDAIRTSGEITQTYRRYLQSLLAVRDPQIGAALQQAIEHTELLDKGPFLEATPPYAPGASLRQLIDDGALAPAFSDLASEALPLDRPLYAHQERAIRKVAAGRNVIVSTGTGSGKTESFLLPILDSLVREQTAGLLGPGVRALLLYPMNALANDQMKRLRQVLAAYPHITFGRYTGDTETDPERAREAFEELNIGEPILPNELLSRQEMRATPPHLLLTNYAMLEYLLLRPQDMDLFGRTGSSPWRFLVVDEAHVYDGSQGAEVAMLLRRVRDRVAPDRSIQCIATSATVGADTDPGAVTRFAANLFGEAFEWEPDDPERQDLVGPTRVDLVDGPLWGPLAAHDYIALAASEDRERALLDAARHAGWTGVGSAVDAIQREQSLAALRRRLASGPQDVRRICAALFGDDPDGPAGLAALVEVASALRRPDGTAALSARYHLFLRATEGAFTCLSTSGPHVQLARHTECPDCAAPVFEIGSCKRCGAVHLVGQPELTDKGYVLRPRRRTERPAWFVLGDDMPLEDEDEEAAVDIEMRSSDSAPEAEPAAVVTAGEEARLCVGCGVINERAAAACAGCGGSYVRLVRKLRQKGEEIAGCLVCGARGSGTVRVFETGADASGAVIATSLYQNLPAADDAETGLKPGEGRKLLAFSDSRQAAAYFAPYFERSYRRLQRRRLLMEGLVRAHADAEPVGYDDLVFTTRAAAKKARHFPEGKTAQWERREVAPWVMAEAVATDDRQSLEGLGLLRIVMERPATPAPPPLTALGLTDDEAWALLQELVRTLRQQGAVAMPEEEVPSNDPIFAPRLGPIRVREQGAERMRKVLSWLPTRGTNRRVDYVTKVLAALDASVDPLAVLAGCWRFLTAASTSMTWLARSTERGLGVVHQVNHELLRFTLVTDRDPVYICGVCRRITPVSVRGVCPALGCDGSLDEFVPPPVGEDSDHYRTVYRSMRPVSVTALEHTAQWENTRAAEIQHDFVRGTVNALSCSTTFELGVDVGELQAVLLRNMPPRTANYVQRAGRAGRRAGSAALVVTYAQRRSHDLAKFDKPESMISGVVRAPYVPLANERIDRRHAHSIALAAFFRSTFESTGRIFRKADEFFLSDSTSGAPPCDLVKSFLDPVPASVAESLERVIPREVAAEIGLYDGSWVTRLVELLEHVKVELTTDIEQLDRLSEEAAAAKRFPLAGRYQRVAATLRRRDLLGFLANRNVLPKYGFPVDSVELRTAFGEGKDIGTRLDLTRDLSAAIHEYAPDAQLVAGGQLWVSRGIYRLPGRDLPEYRYLTCSECGAYWQSLDTPDPSCPVCRSVVQAAPRTLTIPEFGFVADPKQREPGDKPPARSWSGATYVVARSPEARERQITLPGGVVETEAGPRGRLVAVADGPGGMGYWICDRCGYGAARSHQPKPPRKHKNPTRHIDCTGMLRALDLAHAYETDLLTQRIRVFGTYSRDAWTSLLYAVVEAACDTLEIARDDIGGSLVPEGAGTWALSLFDRVPGGAGHVLTIEANLEQVLEAALRRVEECECGPETSCYGCLRSFSNQREHEDLSRGAAAEILRRLLGTSEGGTLPPQWEHALSLALPEERDLLRLLHAQGMPVPSIGEETSNGTPVAISWPEQRVALATGQRDSLVEKDLEIEGWRVLPLGDELTSLLAAPSRA